MSFAKQFAPWWEITSCLNSPPLKTNRTQTKAKQTKKPQLFWSSAISNINLQGGTRGNSKGYASAKDAFLLMLASWWGRCPTHASSTMGIALKEPSGKHYEDAVEIDVILCMLWKPKVVPAQRLSYKSNRPSFSRFSDGVIWWQLHLTWKAKVERQLLIPIQRSPLEMHGWWIPSILRQKGETKSLLWPVQMCSGCNESMENLGVEFPSTTCMQHACFRRNMFKCTYLTYVFTNWVEIS